MSTQLYPRDFIFIRHGQAEGNVRNVCQGKIDLPLTDLGREQARLAAQRLLNFKGLSKIYSSTMQRAYDTARIIAEELECPEIEQLDDLQERGWGALEGQPNTLMYEQEELESLPDYREPSKIAGLEEKSAFSKRVFNVMNFILQNAKAEPVLIVSHGRFFHELCEFLAVPAIKQIPNGSPVFCRHSQAGWNLDFL